MAGTKQGLKALVTLLQVQPCPLSADLVSALKLVLDGSVAHSLHV